MQTNPLIGWRNRLKVLPLESWMRREANYCKEHGSVIIGYKTLRPLFNREGVYFDRLTNQSWFEVNGLAFAYDTNQFKHDLYILEVLSTCKRKIAVLELAVREGAATRQQARLVKTYRLYEKKVGTRLHNFRRKKTLLPF